jgi:hypothetical protein
LKVSYKQAKNLRFCRVQTIGATPATFEQMVQVVAAGKELAKRAAD